MTTTPRQQLAIEIVATEFSLSVTEVERRLFAPDDVLLDYQGAADLLGISVNALRGKVHRGTIPHVRLGARTVRFRKGDLVRGAA